jgi:hypothetical protein
MRSEIAAPSAVVWDLLSNTLTSNFEKKHIVYKNAENYNSFVFKDSDTISDFVYTLSEPYDGGILEKKNFTKKVW